MAVSSPDLSEADPAMKLSSAETESDSNDSVQSKGDAKNTLKSNKKAASPKMTLELMAAQWPSHQSVLKQIHPCIFYNIAKKVSSSPPKTSFASAFDISPSLKDSQSSNEMTSDEPLDLSSKTNFDGLVENDARDMHRFKSRLLPLSGRRSYTAEELNSALEDIISGKLGTRRAAVQYNIPRSTLRNKVYKMSSETKRTTPLTVHNVTNMEDLIDNDREKNYVSADETDGYDATIQDNELSLNQSDNIAARSVEENLEKNKYWCKSIPPSDILHIPKETDIQSEEITDPQEEEQKCKSIYPQEPQQSLNQVEQGVWQNVMLQSLLFPGGLPLQTNLEEAVQILKTVLVNQDLSLFSSQLSSKFQKSQPLFGIHKKNQTHRNKHPSPATSQATNFQNPISGSQMPKNKFCEDFNEALANDPSVILRIPSFKPVSYFSTPSSSTSSQSGLCNKNENQIFSPSSGKDSKSSTLGAPSIRDQKLSTELSVLSSNNIPLSSSKSPATVSLREVIANSISRTFNHQAKFDAINSSSDPSTCSPLENCELYKQPSISVIKNIGGTDTYSFGAVPNLLGNCAESNQSQHSYCQTAPNSSMCSGKGTRPKRGKYRNYDRDSLVEAVKAVQRGEMSVHRAGSYYGVPHSTLEYKVKERHLMRPRKRESKSRPSLDDHPGDNNAFCDLSTSIPDSNKPLKISGLSVESKNDVNESSYILQAQSFLNKKKALYSRASNGIKMPPLLFDQRSTTEQQHSPNLFWQENFEPLQMDTGTHSHEITVPRIDEGETASSGYSQSFSQLELKSQVPCELRREHIKTKLLQGFPMSNSNICTRGQNAEVIAEKLFPSQVSAKGSFLDDIIRKTLDRKISESGKKTPPPLFVPITGCMERNQQNVKRSRNSPINHGSVEVKRERFTATLDSNPKIQSSTPEVTTMNLIEGIHKANPDIASTSICNKSSLESSSQGSHLENVKYGIEDSL